jgi:hypothetical protein
MPRKPFACDVAQLVVFKKDQRPAVPDVSHVAQGAAGSEGLTGTRDDYSIGQYLSGFLGEQPA